VLASAERYDLAGTLDGQPIAIYGIAALFNGGLKQQAEFDLQAFQRATGRTLNEAEQEEFRAVQLPALRWTYLGSAMVHPKFLGTVDEFSPSARKQIEEMAPVYS